MLDWRVHPAEINMRFANISRIYMLSRYQRCYEEFFLGVWALEWA